MDPQVQQLIYKIMGTLFMSEITGPIDDAKLYWQILSHLPLPVIIFLVIKFLWPWITGKYRIRF